jgi:hypothetical protein
MPLKLRPTGLGSGIDKDRPDYTVFTGDVGEVGRITRPAAAGVRTEHHPRGETSCPLSFSYA